MLVGRLFGGSIHRATNKHRRSLEASDLRRLALISDFQGIGSIYLTFGTCDGTLEVILVLEHSDS